MNRFEWMMVLVCGLGLAWVLTHQPAPVPPPPAAPVSETAPVLPTTPGVAPAGVVETPAADSSATATAVETILRNPAAEYTFTSLGGGIKEVKILQRMTEVN